MQCLKQMFNTIMQHISQNQVIITYVTNVALIAERHHIAAFKQLLLFLSEKAINST